MRRSPRPSLLFTSVVLHHAPLLSMALTTQRPSVDRKRAHLPSAPTGPIPMATLEGPAIWIGQWIGDDFAKGGVCRLTDHTAMFLLETCCMTEFLRKRHHALF
jgi:hypothetical protein